MAASGPVALLPADINTSLISIATGLAPGLTVLPAGLIEDMSSTATAGVYLMDQARIETINSVTPYGCNAYVLNQLGQIYGVSQGVNVNTSVNVVFTGTPYYFVQAGVTVSDGTYQYIVQNGVTLGANGVSPLAYCLAVQSGTWAVAQNTVTTILTSIPKTIALSVTNPVTGVSATATQSVQDYRTQVLAAGQALATSCLSQLKTNILAIPGVQPRLVRVIPQSNAYEIIVGGGDPYQIGNAIFNAIGWLPGLTGSTISNSRNVIVSIYQYPDSYSIPFVNPPAQEVGVTLTWNTTATNYISQSAVTQLAIPAIVNYINSIPVGYPINVYQMQTVFTESITSVLSSALVVKILFNVTINGVSTPAVTNEGIIVGDPESYFLTDSTQIKIVQG